MPYKSQAQAGWFHTQGIKELGAAEVKKWDRATKGKHLPARVEKPKSNRVTDHLKKS